MSEPTEDTMPPKILQRMKRAFWFNLNVPFVHLRIRIPDSGEPTVTYGFLKDGKAYGKDEDIKVA